MYASILLVVVSLFSLNARASDDASQISYSFGLGGGQASVDEVSSAEVAARIAQEGDLLVADNVQNLSDSLNAQVDFATTYESYLAKPQIVATQGETVDDIHVYAAQKGDTVGSVARRFNVTSDTVRWANNLTDDAITKGTKLTISPVSGILHTVKEGDTPETLAQKYRANKEQIIAFNDAEVSGLEVGNRIVVPDGVKPEASTPTYFSSTAATTVATADTGSSNAQFAFGNQPLYGGNGYSYGYCTWHAANRRAAAGKPIPRNLGNAVTWATLAAQAGLGVDGTPRAGDVLWHKNTYTAGGFGHVAFVERINKDGSILVSDMNYAGWNVVSTRTVKQGEFGNYLFIH